MEPLEYLRVLRRRWPIVAVVVVLAVGIVWWMTPEQAEDQPEGPRTATYTATHTLFQAPAGRGGGNQLDTMAVLATRGDIPRRVVERLGWDIEPALLAQEVSVSADSRQGTLTVSSTGPDGERAALVANTFAEEIVTYFEEQLERRDQETMERLREQMAQQLQEARDLDQQLRAFPPVEEGEQEDVEASIMREQREALLRQYGINLDRLQDLETRAPTALDLYTLEDAVPVPNLDQGGFEAPATRAGRLPLAAGVALVLGVGLALAADHLDTRVRTRRGAESAFGLPVVTEIPKSRVRERRSAGLSVVSKPTSDLAEAYRILRLSLQLMPRWILSTTPAVGGDGPTAPSALQPTIAASDQPPRVVLVTSPGPGEGKTVTVANLAASFAESGKTVCVVDCDLRAPELHYYLGTEDRPGVTDFLGHADGDIRRHARPTTVPGVWLVPAGTPVANPGEVLGPDQGLIDAALETADVVLIDSGPLLAVNDPAALIPRIDAVVVVARSGRTTGDAAQRTRELLARLHAPVLGVALVAVSRKLVSSSSTSRLRRGGPAGLLHRKHARGQEPSSHAAGFGHVDRSVQQKEQ